MKWFQPRYFHCCLEVGRGLWVCLCEQGNSPKGLYLHFNTFSANLWPKLPIYMGMLLIILVDHLADSPHMATAAVAPAHKRTANN